MKQAIEYKIKYAVPLKVFDELLEYVTATSVKQNETVKPVFKTDDFCLYNDDCLKVMSKFTNNYIDIIFADLPY